MDTQILAMALLRKNKIKYKKIFVALVTGPKKLEWVGRLAVVFVFVFCQSSTQLHFFCFFAKE